MLSPNFKKQISGAYNATSHRLYPETVASKSCQNISLNKLNRQTIDLIRSRQKDKLKQTPKEELSQRRMEKVVQYREGLKEIFQIEPELEEMWNMFDFEKNILKMEISSLLKQSLERNQGLHICMLLEGLEFFFNDIRQPIDLLEVPANGMVSEILKSKLTCQEDQISLSLEKEHQNQSVVLSKSVQLLLKAGEIKEMLSQKLMIEKICENKELHVSRLEQAMNIQSLEKKLTKQSTKVQELEESLICKDKQTEFLRKILNNIIEKNGVMANGVNTLFKMFQSTNDLQRTLQTINSQGSPQRTIHNENLYTISEQANSKSKIQHAKDINSLKRNSHARGIWMDESQWDDSHAKDAHKNKLLFKDTLGKQNQFNSEEKQQTKNEYEQQKAKQIFSPMKGKQGSGHGNSDRDIQTPKTATFAEISKFCLMLLIMKVRGTLMMPG